MLRSTPDLGVKTQRTNGPTPLTLFGAPCNVEPPFSNHELTQWYKGCQNVPTEVWLASFFSNSPIRHNGGMQNNNIVTSAQDSSHAALNRPSVDVAVSGDSSQEISVNSIPTT